MIDAELFKNALSTCDKKKPLNVSLIYEDGTEFDICNITQLCCNSFRFSDSNGHRKVMLINGNNFTISHADSNVGVPSTHTGQFQIQLWQTAD